MSELSRGSILSGARFRLFINAQFISRWEYDRCLYWKPHLSELGVGEYCFARSALNKENQITNDYYRIYLTPRRDTHYFIK
jgi:hypothetical protein